MKSPIEVTPELLRTIPLPQPEQGGDKDERGQVMVIAGSPEMPGVAVLAATATARAGAGRLRIGAGESFALHLGFAVPEARVFALDQTDGGGVSPAAAESLLSAMRSCDAVLVGPGMVDAEAVEALTAALLSGAGGAGFVLDALALTGLSPERLAGRKGPVIVTPHAGEMTRLLGKEEGEISADPLDAARQAAARFNVVAVLKGRTTYIATPQGETWRHTGGNVGLAASGSGDVLAGLITGLLARGVPPEQAAVWGVYLHGQAAERLATRQGAPLGFLARELAGEVPAILAEFASPA